MRRAWLILVVLLALGAVGAAGCGGAAPFPTATANGAKLVSRTSGRYFETFDKGNWGRYIIKGANIGASLPGQWFGQVPIDKDTAAKWFRDISAMNANTVLIYTLLKPGFYQALDEFNKSHPGREIMLVQQFWPDDQFSPGNLYQKDYAAKYTKEMKLDIDALNGETDIPQRVGFAWGSYDTNVMPYVLAILTGREVTAGEVAQTDADNPAMNHYDGGYVKTTAGASPMECWYAQMADTAQGYMKSKYGWQVPVGYVSWPTLDPMSHPTERTAGLSKSGEVDDSQVVDPAHIQPGTLSGGLYGTYQVYPYYPEFMYREPGYASYTDEFGVLRFGGYLEQLMSYLPDYPAMIGEFGLPTSINMSHDQPEGFSQGQLEETDQGHRLARMYKAILRTGYAGGFIFEWADEWAKKNWVYYSTMVPFDRHVLWHNVMDPEQNFGVLAHEPDIEPFGGNMNRLWSAGGTSAGAGQLAGMEAQANAEYLFLAFEFRGGGANGLRPGSPGDLELSVGIDMLGPNKGTTALPVSGLPQTPTGSEFLLRLSPQGGKLLVRHDYSRGTSLLSAAPARDPNFEQVVFIINRAQVSDATGEIFPIILTNQSDLNYGDFNPADKGFNSIAHWYVENGGGRVMVRLPWQLINVTDPSSHSVILDNSKHIAPGPVGLRNLGVDGLTVTKTKGLLFYAATTSAGKLVDYQPRAADGKGFSKDVGRYLWPGWENTPGTHGRLKKDYPVLQQLFQDVTQYVPGG